jgi:hypothetical protein
MDEGIPLKPTVKYSRGPDRDEDFPSARFFVLFLNQLGYKKPVCTSQETSPLRYCSQPVNAMYDLRFSRRWRRKPSSGIYQNTVCTSQETRHLSATEPSRLILCKIWVFHVTHCEKRRLLGYRNRVRISHEHITSSRPPALGWQESASYEQR